jgi:hypothetical protein
VADVPEADPSDGCDNGGKLLVSGQPSGARLDGAALDDAVAAGACSSGAVAAAPRPIVAPVFGVVSLQPLAKLSGALMDVVFAGVVGCDGSLRTL